MNNSSDVTKTRNRPGPSKGGGAQRVYDHVRAKILSLEFTPGSDVSEAALVKQLGVSRTPVREALVRLTSEGFIVGTPHQGVPCVAPMDIQSTGEILDALELCQRAASRWAARNRSEHDLSHLESRHAEFIAAAHSMNFDSVVEGNRAFHSAIGAACGNAIIADLYDSLLNKSLRIARLIFSRRLPHLKPNQRYDVVIKEHEDLLSAIRAGDMDQADALGLQHARLFRSAVATFISENRNGDMIVSDQVDLPRMT